MSRYLFSNAGRNMVWVAGLAMAAQLLVQQPAHADVNWVTDVLNPMMNQVIGPALQKGLTAWQAKHTKSGSSPMVDVPTVGGAVPSSVVPPSSAAAPSSAAPVYIGGAAPSSVVTTNVSTSPSSTASTVPTATPQEPVNSSLQWGSAFN